MKKQLLLSLFALLSVTTARAEDANHLLVVWQQSGEKVYFDFPEEYEKEQTTDDGQQTTEPDDDDVFPFGF